MDQTAYCLSKIVSYKQIFKVLEGLFLNADVIQPLEIVIVLSLIYLAGEYRVSVKECSYSKLKKITEL